MVSTVYCVRLMSHRPLPQKQIIHYRLIIIIIIREYHRARW